MMNPQLKRPRRILRSLLMLRCARVFACVCVCVWVCGCVGVWMGGCLGVVYLFACVSVYI